MQTVAAPIEEVAVPDIAAIPTAFQFTPQTRFQQNDRIVDDVTRT